MNSTKSVGNFVSGFVLVLIFASPVLSFTSSTIPASQSWFGSGSLSWLASYWSGSLNGGGGGGHGHHDDETEYDFFENRQPAPDESSDEENDAKLWQDMINSIKSWQERKLTKHRSANKLWAM